MKVREGAHAPDYQKTRHPHRGGCHDSAGNHFDFTANHLKTNDFGKKDFPQNHEDFLRNQNDSI
jgi:hypothetical protein